MKIIKSDLNKAIIMISEDFYALSTYESKDKVMGLFKEGYYNLTFDFTNVATLSSSGLGRLIMFQKIAKENNGEIDIINVKSSHVRNMLDAINLKSIINYQ